MTFEVPAPDLSALKNLIKEWARGKGVVCNDADLKLFLDFVAEVATIGYGRTSDKNSLTWSILKDCISADNPIIMACRDTFLCFGSTFQIKFNYINEQEDCFIYLDRQQFNKRYTLTQTDEYIVKTITTSLVALGLNLTADLVFEIVIKPSIAASESVYSTTLASSPESLEWRVWTAISGDTPAAATIRAALGCIIGEPVKAVIALKPA